MTDSGRLHRLPSCCDKQYLRIPDPDRFGDYCGNCGKSLVPPLVSATGTQSSPLDIPDPTGCYCPDDGEECGGRCVSAPERWGQESTPEPYSDPYERASLLGKIGGMEINAKSYKARMGEQEATIAELREHVQRLTAALESIADVCNCTKQCECSTHMIKIAEGALR